MKFIDTSSIQQLRIYIVNATCVKQGWVSLDYVPFTVRIEFAREQQNTAEKKDKKKIIVVYAEDHTNTSHEFE